MGAPVTHAVLPTQDRGEEVAGFFCHHFKHNGFGYARMSRGYGHPIAIHYYDADFRDHTLEIDRATGRYHHVEANRQELCR
jgi:hypothetical protein